jgi:hypothetical protein
MRFGEHTCCFIDCNFYDALLYAAEVAIDGKIEEISVIADSPVAARGLVVMHLGGRKWKNIRARHIEKVDATEQPSVSTSS